MSLAAWAVDAPSLGQNAHADSVRWGAVLLGLLELALLALFVAAIAAAVVSWMRRRERARGTDSAEAILATRFAEGELDATEYELRRDVLRG